TSTTSTKDLPPGGDVATPHARADGKPIAIKYRNIDNIAPAGSINSSVLEMAQHVRFHLRAGTYQAKRLLSKQYHDEMLTLQLIGGRGQDSLMPMVHFDTYGLALWLRDYYGKKLVSHGGGIDGMLSQMAWIPEADVGVVVLTNTDGQNLQNALTYKILDQLLGAPDRDWSGIYLAQSQLAEKRGDSVRAALPSHPVAGTKPSLALEQYTGTYDNPFYGPLRIEQDGAGLVLRRSSVSWAKLEHWHFDTFRIEWNTSRTPGAGSFAMFQVDPNGRAMVLEVRGQPFASPYAEGALFTRKAEERAATGSN